jgi:hypothetical protein
MFLNKLLSTLAIFLTWISLILHIIVLIFVPFGDAWELLSGPGGSEFAPTLRAAFIKYSYDIPSSSLVATLVLFVIGSVLALYSIYGVAKNKPYTWIYLIISSFIVGLPYLIFRNVVISSFFTGLLFTDYLIFTYFYALLMVFLTAVMVSSKKKQSLFFALCSILTVLTSVKLTRSYQFYLFRAGYYLFIVALLLCVLGAFLNIFVGQGDKREERNVLIGEVSNDSI